MQSILQSVLSRFATDKILHNFQLFFTASFESAGVVEDISVVVSEDEFVLDVMDVTLCKYHPYCQPSSIRMIQPDLHARAEFNLNR